MKISLLIIFISLILVFSLSAQYCYIMEDGRTHPTLGYATTKTGTPLASLACPNNIGVPTQEYVSLTSKPANLCFATDPWTYMTSTAGRPGTYRNCKVGNSCGFMISPIAIVNCPIDRSTPFLLLIAASSGFFVIRKRKISTLDVDLLKIK